MMSQMKQGNPAVRWSEVAEAWNANRFEWEDEMTWRAVTRRWGRIVDKLGPWPGFDVSIHFTLSLTSISVDLVVNYSIQ